MKKSKKLKKFIIVAFIIGTIYSLCTFVSIASPANNSNESVDLGSLLGINEDNQSCTESRDLGTIGEQYTYVSAYDSIIGDDFWFSADEVIDDDFFGSDSEISEETTEETTEEITEETTDYVSEDFLFWITR